jgi:hypothetical protein
MIGEYIATGAAVGGVFGVSQQIWNMKPVQGYQIRGPAFIAFTKGALGPAVHFAIAGGLYAFGITSMKQIRSKDDSLNGAAGGFLAGVYAGLKGSHGVHGAISRGLGFGMVGIASTFLGTYLEERANKSKATNE